MAVKIIEFRDTCKQGVEYFSSVKDTDYCDEDSLTQYELLEVIIDASIYLNTDHTVDLSVTVQHNLSFSIHIYDIMGIERV